MSLFLLVLMGVYIQYNINTMYALHLFNKEINLPISIWMVVPAIFLLLFTILHFTFFTSLRFFKEKKLQKDLNQIPSIIESCIVQKTTPVKIGDKRLKSLVDFINHTQFEVSNDYKSNDEKIQKAVDKVSALNSGEVTEIDEYKLEKKGAIYQRNLQNKLKNESLLAEKALEEANDDSVLFNEAKEVLITTSDRKTIEKNNIVWDSKTLLLFLSRYQADTNAIVLEYDDIKEYLSKTTLSSSDFIVLAKKLFQQISPDEVIELFYHLQRDFDNASAAYLYINLELEKMEESIKYLEQFAEDELEEFRFYLILKENGAKVSLDTYIK
jgi:hypothetical protein